MSASCIWSDSWGSPRINTAGSLRPSKRRTPGAAFQRPGKGFRSLSQLRMLWIELVFGLSSASKVLPPLESHSTVALVYLIAVSGERLGLNFAHSIVQPSWREPKDIQGHFAVRGSNFNHLSTIGSTSGCNDPSHPDVRMSTETKARDAHHATVSERLDYIEKTLGDSADKHEQELKAAHSKIDQVHHRVSSNLHEDSRQQWRQPTCEHPKRRSINYDLQKRWYDRYDKPICARHAIHQ